MAARYVSSQVIQTIQKGGKNVMIEYVDKTSAWIRPSGFPSAGVRSDFVQVVQENIESLQPTTAAVAMKYDHLVSSNYGVFADYQERESEHQSDKDKRMHYTAFELDSNRTVICTSHFVKQMTG